MRSRIKIVLAYATFAALWIFGSDRLLAQLVHDPMLLAWIGTVKGLAFVGVTSLLLYLLLRIWGGAGNGSNQPITRMRIRGLMLLFLGLFLIAPLLGYSIFQLYSVQTREDAFADLGAIAVLKTDQIESWLAQSQASAEVLSRDQEFAQSAVLLLRGAVNEGARGRVRARLDALRQVYGYDGVLLDAAGRAALTVGEHAEISPDIKQRLLPLALSSGQVQRSELYRDASGAIHLDYVVPLPQQGAGRAAILLHTPVEHFLFPLIQRWPTPSESAETTLVRRDGDSVLYLNELRHQSGTALTLRAPLDKLQSPSVLAVLAGQARHMDTVDRRGVAVLAASRPVAGTAWYVVAKIDRDEVLAPLKRLVLWVSVVALAAVAAVAAALLMLWRQQQRAHRLELIAQSAERDRLLKLFFDLPFVGMSITSPVTKRWLHVNDRLCEILGYTREEMMALTWVELTYPDDLAPDMAEFERVLKGEIDDYQLDKRFVRKDGTIVEATTNVKTVRNADGSVEWFVATIQDITAHKHAERVQQTLSDRITSLLESMIDGFVALDKDWRYLYVNRHAGELFGREPASLIGKQIWEEFPEGVGQPFYEAYQRVMAQQTPEQIEDYYPPWTRWFENRIYPTPDGISIYFQDITARKVMEEQLHQRLAELTRWQDVMLGREDRVQELKREVNDLLVLLGQPIRYSSQARA